MGQTFHPYDPEQSHLFPPAPRDWMAEGHLAFFVADTVEELDLARFYDKFQSRKNDRGNLAYEPRMMLKLLIYGYCVGIFSSRKIATGVDDLVALRFLAAGNRPGHRTIARFRRDHAALFADVFMQVVRIAQQAKLVGMGTIAIDGSRVRANASKRKAMSYGRMCMEEKRLTKEIDELIKRADGVDAAEDIEFGPEFRGDEVPEELRDRKSRRAAIREAIKALKEEQAEKDEAAGRGKAPHPQRKRENGTPPDKAQMNFTDPESKIMKTPTGGFEQCFNAQIAVDSKDQIIVSTGVTRNGTDVQSLIPTLDRAVDCTGESPKRLLADAGYKSEANLAALESRDIEGYVSIGIREETKVKAANAGPATRRMHERLKTAEGRALYKTRKHVVEPAFAWAKHVLGFRSFSMRGLEKVRAEWDLVCLATNLRRMNDKIEWI